MSFPTLLEQWKALFYVFDILQILKNKRTLKEKNRKILLEFWILWPINILVIWILWPVNILMILISILSLICKCSNFLYKFNMFVTPIMTQWYNCLYPAWTGLMFWAKIWFNSINFIETVDVKNSSAILLDGLACRDIIIWRKNGSLLI